MELQVIDALQAFVDQVPRELVDSARERQMRFEIQQVGPEVHAQMTANNGKKMDLEMHFDSDSHALTRCLCSCSLGRRGSLCAHLIGLATRLIDEMRPGDEVDVQKLEYLDKYLASAAVTEPQFRLEIHLSDDSGFLVPEILMERRIGFGTFAKSRRFTANDSYKLNQGDPHDQNVLEYVKNFRQVVFYSSYKPHRKYPWGFWLSLLEHPRVIWNDQRVTVEHGEVAFRFESLPGDRYRLRVAPENLEDGDIGAYAVDGGIVFVNHEVGQLVVTQVDRFRTQIVRDTMAAQPVLTRRELLGNIHRLERLQTLFEFTLPAVVDDAIDDATPEVVLQLELNPLEGLSLRPRIRYQDVEERLSLNDDAVYLMTRQGDLVRRNRIEERARLNDFAERFPLEFGDGSHDDIGILELDQAFAAIDWLKDNGDWPLEWLKRKPKVTHLDTQPRLRLAVDAKGYLKVHLTTDDVNYLLDHVVDVDAASLNSDYVAVGEHEWVQINAQLRTQLNRLKFAISNERGRLRLKNASIPLLAELDDVEWEGAESWKDRLRRWRDLDLTKYVPSKQLNADLRGYQLEGYRWLRKMSDLEIGACLADDMGLGKTVQALAALLDRVADGPILVVAPASVVFNWREEIARFAPSLNPVIYAEGGRGKRLGRLKSGDVILVSYALLLRDIEALGKRLWGSLILDEAQFIKNALSQTAQAATKLRRKWTLALTGTPLENHLGELWSIFRMVDPAILGEWRGFRQQFVAPIEKDRDQARLETLRLMIQPFILRRTKDEVLRDLPDRTEIVLRVDMPESQRTRYLDEKHRILSQLDSNPDNLRMRLLTGILRLRQLACHPGLVDMRYKGESTKLNVFSQLVQEMVSESHRALVFSQFTSFLELISKELNRIHVPYLTMTGETPVKHRHKLIKRFQKGEVPVFLVSLRAGGTGINLTHANYVFHMDPWWNPAVEDQATDRAHRIGQTKAVTVYRLIAKDSIEEAILDIHERKKEIVDSLLSGQDQSSRLSIEDMIALVHGGQG